MAFDIDTIIGGDTIKSLFFTAKRCISKQPIKYSTQRGH